MSNQTEQYVEQVNKIYGRAYQEFLNSYRDMPKAMTSTSRGAVSKQREFTKAVTVGATPMFFEDIAVGAGFSTGETMVSQSDIESFADLTGDRNKLHLDNDFAKSIGFQSVIGHGVLSLSVAMGLWDSLALTSATTLALAGFNNVSFKAPVYPGDKLRLDAVVLGTRESKSKPTAGLVTLKFILLNDNGTVIMEAEPVLVISRRPK